MESGARFALPAAPGTNRTLYFFRGESLRIGAATGVSVLRKSIWPSVSDTAKTSRGVAEVTPTAMGRSFVV